MVGKEKNRKFVEKGAQGFVIRLNKRIYCDRAILPVLRDISREGVATYLDEDGDEWIIWIKTDRVEDALSVATQIFSYAMDNGLLGW